MPPAILVRLRTFLSAVFLSAMALVFYLRSKIRSFLHRYKATARPSLLGCFARGMALQLFVKHLTVCRIAGLYNVLQTGKAGANHQKETARGAAHKNAGAIERFLGAAWDFSIGQMSWCHSFVIPGAFTISGFQ